MMIRAALLTLLFSGAAAWAEDGEPTTAPTGRVIENGRPEAIEDMRKKLERDPELQEMLVERVMRSKVAGEISGELEDDKKRAEVRAWIQRDLGSSAELALLLAKDDAAGTRLFEDALIKRMRMPTRTHTSDRRALGVLKGAAKNSKLIRNLDEKVGEEEKRELLRSLFEGKGSQGEKIITGQAPEGKAVSDPPASGALVSSFYDRLSAGNLRGYSPHLMALQSALNTRRPPGAPALIETGKLDHATLSYPAYGLKFDLKNLEERLRRARLAELATLGGIRLAESDMKDPGLEERLLAKVAADKLPKSFAARASASARAKAALLAFETAAARSKDPNQITKALLVELSGRQREAARWITAASLEEELARIELEEGFLTADLLAAIDAAPAEAPIRAAYKRRGESHKERLGKLKTNARSALDALMSEEWLGRIAAIDALLTESRALRRNLSRDISDYRLVPFRLADAVLKQARWRELLDDLIVKYAKSTSYGRAVAARRGNLSRLMAIFAQIASGNSESAHASLVSSELR